MSGVDRDGNKDQVAALKTKVAGQIFKVQVLYGSAIRKAKDRRLLDARSLTVDHLGENLKTPPTGG